MVSTALLAVAAVELTVLLLSSGALALALWRHGEYILYPEGVAYYATALFVLTLAAVVDVAGEATGRWTLELVSDVLFTFASGVGAAAAWYFARDFIRTGDESEPTISVEEAEETEGFEDA